MTKRFLLAALTLLVPVLPLTVGAPADGAAARVSRSCLSQAEWARIHVGMSQAQVDAVAGVAGELVEREYDWDGRIDDSIAYRQCDARGVRSPDSLDAIVVSFHNDAGFDASGQRVIGPFVSYAKQFWTTPERVVTPAMAGRSREYCSAAEVAQLHRGMSKGKVAQVMDGNGQRVNAARSRGPGTESRQYGLDHRRNGTVEYCVLDFRHGRLRSWVRTAY